MPYRRGGMSRLDKDIANRKARQQAISNKRENERLSERIKQLESRPQAKAAPKPKPKPKPKPNSGSQQIAPVKASPEIAQAKSRVQEYQKKDYSSIFKQNETDYTAKFQPSAAKSTQPKAANNEKYQFQAPPQTDTTANNPMTGADILNKDKQQYGSYM